MLKACMRCRQLNSSLDRQSTQKSFLLFHCTHESTYRQTATKAGMQTQHILFGRLMQACTQESSSPMKGMCCSKYSRISWAKRLGWGTLPMDACNCFLVACALAPSSSPLLTMPVMSM